MLASELSKVAGWPVICIDEYLRPGNDTYVPSIDFGRLRYSIEASKDYVLVEGVCVLDVLARIPVKPAGLIYVKRLNRNGRWVDEDESSFECPVEEKLAELEGQAALFLTCSSEPTDNPSGLGRSAARLFQFREEVIRYHARVRPFERANFIYERIDCDQ